MSVHDIKMKFEQEQTRLRGLLIETVNSLCKSGLSYHHNLKVQGVLGITVDDDHVCLVHINEKFENAMVHSMRPIEERCPSVLPPDLRDDPQNSRAAMHSGIPAQVMRDRQSRLSRPAPYQHPKVDAMAERGRYSDSSSQDIDVVMVSEHGSSSTSSLTQAEAFQKSLGFSISSEGLIRPSSHNLSLMVNNNPLASAPHVAVSKRHLLALRAAQGPSSATPTALSDFLDNSTNVRVKTEHGEEILILDPYQLQHLQQQLQQHLQPPPPPPEHPVSTQGGILTKGAQKFINSSVMAEQMLQQQQHMESEARLMTPSHPSPRVNNSAENVHHKNSSPSPPPPVLLNASSSSVPSSLHPVTTWSTVHGIPGHLKLALASQSSSPASSGGTAPEVCDVDVRREYGGSDYPSRATMSREVSPALPLHTPTPQLQQDSLSGCLNASSPAPPQPKPQQVSAILRNVLS